GMLPQCPTVKKKTEAPMLHPPMESIDSTSVLFSQDSISSTFTDGRTLEESITGLGNGTILPADLPAIRLVNRDGLLYTLDNRRLYVFQQAGQKIPFRMATPEEIEAEAWKFTTKTGGKTIRIRPPRQ
ncbi:MAG: hypothetical protein WA798_07060, partial [Candidatus Acidiferrum sp.]